MALCNQTLMDCGVRGVWGPGAGGAFFPDLAGLGCGFVRVSAFVGLPWPVRPAPQPNGRCPVRAVACAAICPAAPLGGYTP